MTDRYGRPEGFDIWDAAGDPPVDSHDWGASGDDRGYCSNCGVTHKTAEIFHWMDCDDFIEERAMEIAFETAAS